MMLRVPLDHDAFHWSTCAGDASLDAVRECACLRDRAAPLPQCGICGPDAAGTTAAAARAEGCRGVPSSTLALGPASGEVQDYMARCVPRFVPLSRIITKKIGYCWQWVMPRARALQSATPMRVAIDHEAVHELGKAALEWPRL